jgi:hypothetical protein
VISEKVVKLDSYHQHVENAKYVVERDYRKDIAKLKDHIEFVDEKHKQ